MLLGVDGTVVVGIASAITSLGAAAFTAFGVWYGAKRQADANEHATDKTHEATITEKAQAVLLSSLDRMQGELSRQDEEHAAEIARLRSDHTEAMERLRSDHDRALGAERVKREQDMAKLQEQVNTIREHHEQCMERNGALERELAELRRG